MVCQLLCGSLIVFWSGGGEIVIRIVPSNFPRFIEHGEYKENQYGTSIEAIRSVQAKNKMCLVDVQPEVGNTGRQY